MGNLLEHVEDSILSRRLLRRGQRILVAVSGGLDSMVLLHLLQALSEKHGWLLAVAHLNHQLRGRSSHADERLVRRTAERLGLTAIVERADVRAFAYRHKCSIEMAARNLRHAFLARNATHHRIPTVALAHHADDQLELFFLRLLRGSGGEGLAGMKWRNLSPANPKIELVRPLLDLPKRALREHAAEKHVPFREDETNASWDIQRNRIRHELLPLFRKHYQQALDKTVLRLMDILAADAEFVTQAAEAWLDSPRGSTPFEALPVAVQRRCVHLQLLRRGVGPEFDLVERLRLNARDPINVPGLNLLQVARNAAGRLVLQQPEKGLSNLKCRRLNLTGGAGKLRFDGVRLQWRIETKRGVARPKADAEREFFDADKVGSAILVRHWRPGDRFLPIGMAQEVKLQDFFTNQKVPRRQRHELLVAETARGEVFWVEGMRISERFKLTRGTIHRLQWGWLRL
ncbi:MAG TPA: tRNA lysidine(34) synthetase TilS [Candidatus Acidoferrum sp.]|nr:tRNA lysidine(34) synthetase TilS [Candidatus Acidoferrum sp.]